MGFYKKYRKRYGKNDYQGMIPNCIDIDERPSIVDTCACIGDCEVDLVIGKRHKGDFLLPWSNARAGFILPCLFKRKTTKTSNDAITKLLMPFKCRWLFVKKKHSYQQI